MSVDDTPVAYAYEVRAADYHAWQKRVDFEHPKNTYCSYGGFEVRNVRPLFTDTDLIEDK